MSDAWESFERVGYLLDEAKAKLKGATVLFKEAMLEIDGDLADEFRRRWFEITGIEVPE